MNHSDHVRLLKAGVDAHTGAWADLGAGQGAFTLALADLLGSGSRIYSVDRDLKALERQAATMAERFPGSNVDYIRADFAQPLPLPVLDGVVMANSLHFQRDKRPVLDRVFGYLKPGGRFVLVEYNADRGNYWVPHPVSFATWQAMAAEIGFSETRLLAKVSSRFLGEIYSALSVKSG